VKHSVTLFTFAEVMMKHQVACFFLTHTIC